MRSKWEALAERLNGIPRTAIELERSLKLLGVLRKLGFQQSVRAGMQIDASGAAVPWWTYAANEWVKTRIRPTDRVFEYGCGGSTLWLSAHAGSVVSVEHCKEWYEKVSPQLPANAKLLYRQAETEDGDNVDTPYSSAILEHAPPFDIIVIDGMERNACARLATKAISDTSIIIFDNSHRSAYRSGMNALTEAGLWRIDLAGCVPDRSVTSIFGRSLARWLDASQPLEDVGI